MLGLHCCLRAFSSCGGGDYSPVEVSMASPVVGHRLLGTWASVGAALGLCACGSQALKCWLNGCGTQACLPHSHGVWHLPGPGTKPVSPALAYGFLTTGPPGNPLFYIFSDFSTSNNMPLNFS